MSLEFKGKVKLLSFQKRITAAKSYILYQVLVLLLLTADQSKDYTAFIMHFELLFISTLFSTFMI